MAGKFNRFIILISLLVCAGIVLTVFLTMMFTNSPASWDKVIGGSGEDVGYSVQQTRDGGYIIAGSTTSFRTTSFGHGVTDLLLVKTDSRGELLWNKSYGGNNFAYGHSVQQTNDGGYVVVGSADLLGNGHSKIYLLKTDSRGEMEWNKTYGEDDSGNEGYSVQQTSDGGYIIAGTRNSSTSAYLIKTDAKGEIKWTKSYTGNYTNFCYAAQQTKEGGYILVGIANLYHETFHDINVIYLLKTDCNGEIEWNKTYGGYDLDLGFSVEQTSDGGYILTGSANLSDNWQLYLIKTNSNGELEFNKTYGNYSGNYAGNFAEQTRDGGFIITGVYFPLDSDVKILYLVKTDNMGEVKWERTYVGRGQSEGYSVGQTRDGGYIITGVTETGWGDDQDIYLIKIAPEL